ncbi:MAG: hypothetical protein K8R74_03145 [Bacteroidales bacterium]|nr:hypothetical protein [Bacteroidales bacterium]
MGSPSSALTEITKIGNYAIPAFGAVVTVAIALGPIGKEVQKGSSIIVSFALYTLFTAFVSYLHRLLYLGAVKHKRKEVKNHLIFHYIKVKGSNLRLTVAGYFDMDTSCPGH